MLQEVKKRLAGKSSRPIHDETFRFGYHGYCSDDHQHKPRFSSSFFLLLSNDNNFVIRDFSRDRLTSSYSHDRPDAERQAFGVPSDNTTLRSTCTSQQRKLRRTANDDASMDFLELREVRQATLVSFRSGNR